MPTLDVQGARLHYERAGRGEPMLWITGFAISSRVFEPVLERYRNDFDCVSYDNRGAGRSSAPWSATSMPQLAGDAVALLDVLQLDSAHVYGVSMGGMVAQELAIRWPDRVRALVLDATSPGGPRSVLPEVTELAALGVRRVPLSAAVRARLVGSALFSPGFRTEHPELVARYLTLLGAHESTARGAVAHLVASVYHDTSSRLGSVQAPTLILHGTQDRLCPPGNAELLRRLIPDAEIGWLPGAGHAAFLEQPQRCYDLLMGWLRRRGPIRPGTPLRGLPARLEPVTRALGLPVGAARAGRSLASLGTARALDLLRGVGGR